MPPADSALKRLAGRNNPAKWFISVLEGVQSSFSPPRTDAGWIHPSTLGDPCDAAIAFQFLGAPGVQEISARLQRIFDNGNCRDEFLKRDTAKAGISLIDPKKLVEFNGRVTEADRVIELPLLRIRGELDEWVKNPANGEVFVIDFKTMNSRLWTELKAVKPDHHLQMLCYEFGKATYKGFVLYENKDNQDWKIFPADFDQAMWEEKITGRIARILKGLEGDIVYRTPVSCTGCPFNTNGVCASNDIYNLKLKSGLYV